MSQRQGLDTKHFEPVPANDQYIKPIAENLRELPKSQFHMTKRQAFERLIELTAELAEKLEPAEVRIPKEKP